MTIPVSSAAPRSGERVDAGDRTFVPAAVPRLRVWTAKGFEGHWPVGTAAVVVARDAEQAAELLEAELAEHGVPQKVDPASLVELGLSLPKAVVLLDGNY